MTAINLALRNLYGYVLWGNSLGSERPKLVYRTGFNLRGFVRELTIGECPPIVQEAANERPLAPSESPAETNSPASIEPAVVRAIEDVRRPGTQLRFF